MCDHVGSRAFPAAGPKTWNAVPEDVPTSQSEYTFRHQLITWLFNKSFPDISVPRDGLRLKIARTTRTISSSSSSSSSDTDCILTFILLGLFVPTLRQFCLSFKVYDMIWCDVTCCPTQVNTPCLNPSQTSLYSINLPWRDGRLSWPRWLGTYRDGLPVCRQSPIQVVTGPDVEQLRWSRPAC